MDKITLSLTSDETINLLKYIGVVKKASSIINGSADFIDNFQKITRIINMKPSDFSQDCLDKIEDKVGNPYLKFIYAKDRAKTAKKKTRVVKTV